MKVVIIGGGWFGCGVALRLAQLDLYEITLLDKNENILQGTSGTFGIRLHKGPHYPRSAATRLSCRQTFDAFSQGYPDFIQEHLYSVYSLAKVRDSANNAPKVSKGVFKEVCEEAEKPLACPEINMEDMGYQNLEGAWNLNEPSILVGEALRKKLLAKLNQANIELLCNYHVSEIRSEASCAIIKGPNGEERSFDYVINATGFQELLPPQLHTNFPVELEVVYQPCLGLKYKHSSPKEKPFSFIVMEGNYPCIMPYIDKLPFDHEYILTHGEYTILSSCSTPEAARNILEKVKEDGDLKERIRSLCEGEIKLFWPQFEKEFHYQEIIGSVIAKIRTQTEFRSSLTFACDRVIYVFPGKISNVISAGEETIKLLKDEDCLTENGIRFTRDGVLHYSKLELSNKPSPNEPNTCNLNTYLELTKSNHLPIVDSDKLVDSETPQNTDKNRANLPLFFTTKTSVQKDNNLLSNHERSHFQHN